MHTRFVAFAGVGALGFVVQTAVFAALIGARWPLVAATAVAVEVAVLHNFAWHERWTWRDRTRGRGGRARRLSAFVLSTGCTSVLGNIGFVLLYTRLFGLDALPASVVANGSAMLLNFAAADRLVFKC